LRMFRVAESGCSFLPEAGGGGGGIVDGEEVVVVAAEAKGGK
jgi:hypothetical protein